ncbi:MAG: phage Gp37/Gp68 family protein [Deltaproteobacteria bacterium]|nr:phage Gp37/Gp68 family protein [Deltaproteobacteria bacterium]
MGKTKIEWADKVWNPVTGCARVSEGCRNCYAEGIAKRFWGDRKFGDVVCHEDRLVQPLRWRKPQRIFVNSMGDLFHPDVPDLFIACVFEQMWRCHNHTFMVLTKLPERMMKWPVMGRHGITPNIWLGVSVEDQATWDERVPALLATPAALHLVSLEPMLGPVDMMLDLQTKDEPYVEWVICGCESGPKSRPMDPDWARSLRDQCDEAGTPFFLKQLQVDGKMIKMPELDGVIHSGRPQDSRD